MLLLLSGAPWTMHGWNSVGHHVIAEMVWQQMDKKERSAASEVLKQHPHYTQLLLADAPQGVDTNEWAFLTAAIWPDLVRPDWEGKTEAISKYDAYPHTIGYPFMFKAETNRGLIEKFSIAKPDAEMVLSNAFATLKNAKASAHDRAVSLCWALHLCGDLHQPLHAATLVTLQNPDGDRFGGHCIVLDADGKTVNLHLFWDCLPGPDANGSYKMINSLAKQLANDRKLKAATRRDFKEHTTIPSWVQESFHTAVNFSYAEDRVQFVREDDLRSGKVEPSQIPRLKADYILQARQIARQRCLLAAERLAAQIKTLR